MTRYRTYGRPQWPLGRWAALLAMALYLVAPFVPAPPAVAGQIQICTAHGIVWAPAPGDDGAPPSHGMPNCPACSLNAHATAPAKAPLPSAIALPLPREHGATVRLTAPDRSPRPVTLTAHRSRAPPLPA